MFGKTLSTKPTAPWLKDLNIAIKLRERYHLRQTAHATEDDTVWNVFRKIRTEIKKAIQAAKSSFYKQAPSSKRPMEVWNTIHPILHPNPQTIKADPEILDKHFNTTAQRLLNSTPKTCMLKWTDWKPSTQPKRLQHLESFLRRHPESDPWTLQWLFNRAR